LIRPSLLYLFIVLLFLYFVLYLLLPAHCPPSRSAPASSSMPYPEQLTSTAPGHKFSNVVNHAAYQDHHVTHSVHNTFHNTEHLPFLNHAAYQDHHITLSIHNIHFTTNYFSFRYAETQSLKRQKSVSVQGKCTRALTFENFCLPLPRAEFSKVNLHNGEFLKSQCPNIFPCQPLHIEFLRICAWCDGIE